MYTYTCTYICLFFICIVYTYIGCFADIKSGPLSVGETQLIPCKNLHFALNKLGNANLTCIEDRRTRLSLTDCTFQRSHSNPLILFQYTVAKKTFNTNNVSLYTLVESLHESIQIILCLSHPYTYA